MGSSDEINNLIDEIFFKKIFPSNCRLILMTTFPELIHDRLVP